MIILRSAVTRPMQRAMRGLLIIAVVIFLSWIASSWINHEELYAAKPETAKAFVQWWVTKAFDYSPDSLNQHNQAKNLMLPEALADFDQTFWTNSAMEEFVITDISNPLVEKSDAKVRVKGKWKFNRSENTYHDVELEFKVSRELGGYYISDWSVERGQLAYHLFKNFGSRLTKDQLRILKQYEQYDCYHTLR